MLIAVATPRMVPIATPSLSLGLGLGLGLGSSYRGAGLRADAIEPGAVKAWHALGINELPRLLDQRVEVAV